MFFQTEYSRRIIFFLLFAVFIVTFYHYCLFYCRLFCFFFLFYSFFSSILLFFLSHIHRVDYLMRLINHFLSYPLFLFHLPGPSISSVSFFLFSYLVHIWFIFFVLIIHIFLRYVSIPLQFARLDIFINLQTMESISVLVSSQFFFLQRLDFSVFFLFLQPLCFSFFSFNFLLFNPFSFDCTNFFSPFFLFKQHL